MIRKLLPVLFILAGAGAGIGAGIVLKPNPSDKQDMAAANSCGDHETADEHDTDHAASPEMSPLEYVSLNNQFIIPVVSKDMVDSLVVVSLGIELDSGNRDLVYQQEPKLRDALLQVMFDHANIGGFRGRFTDGNNLDVLRMSLREAAQSVLGKSVTGVVITDIARQDV